MEEVIDRLSLQIYETNDYDRFEPHPYNRDVKNTKKLEDLMIKAGGFLDSFPISTHYYKKSNSYRIMDGHRRLHAAKKLGIPVKYVVEKVIIQNVAELQNGIEIWKLPDFLNSGCKKGKEDYFIVKNFQETSGLSLSIIVHLLSNKNNKIATQLFRNGEYKVSKNCLRRAQKIKEFVICLRQNDIKICDRDIFLIALSKVSFIDGFDIKKLQKKILKNRPMIQPQLTILNYVQMIDDIYNFHEKEDCRLDIAYLYKKSKKQKTNPGWFKKNEEEDNINEVETIENV